MAGNPYRECMVQIAHAYVQYKYNTYGAVGYLQLVIDYFNRII